MAASRRDTSTTVHSQVRVAAEASGAAEGATGEVVTVGEGMVVVVGMGVEVAMAGVEGMVEVVMEGVGGTPEGGIEEVEGMEGTVREGCGRKRRWRKWKEVFGKGLGDKINERTWKGESSGG